MFTLTKKVEFALIILKHLHKAKAKAKAQTTEENQEPLIKAGEIAGAHRIPENFVAKVMQQLCQKKILLSKLGAQGGYSLNRDLWELSLLELTEGLEGHFTVVNCINENKACVHDHGCPIVDPMRNLNIRLRNFYSNISVAEILSPGNAKWKPPILAKAATKVASKRLVRHQNAVSKKSPSRWWKKILDRSPFFSSADRISAPLPAIKISFLILMFLGLAWGQSAEVNVYSYRQTFLIEKILDRFTQKTGIQANVIFIDKGLAERIRLEGSRSPADVILTTDIGQLDELEKKKIVQPVNSATIDAAIPASLRHHRGLWFSLTTRARIIYASKERVKEGEIRDYSDLTQPRWRKRVCIRSGYHPYNLALFSSLAAHDGIAATESFLKKLQGNLARKPQGNDRAQIKGIKEGLCDVSIGNSYYYALMLLKPDSPEEKEWAQGVNLIFPNQGNRGTHFNVSGMAMALHAPHRESALRLMEFLVSDEAQYLYASDNFEFPIKAGTPLPPFLKTHMSGVKWDDIELEKISSYRREITLLLDKIQFDR